MRLEEEMKRKVVVMSKALDVLDTGLLDGKKYNMEDLEGLVEEMGGDSVALSKGGLELLREVLTGGKKSFPVQVKEGGCFPFLNAKIKVVPDERVPAGCFLVCSLSGEIQAVVKNVKVEEE